MKLNPKDEPRATASPPTSISPVAVDEGCGRYRLSFMLARGGLANVYLAEGEGKVVALKRVHEHLVEEDEFVEVLLAEAKIASRIAHPNVCAIIEAGRANRRPYLAMEYLLAQ